MSCQRRTRPILLRRSCAALLLAGWAGGVLGADVKFGGRITYGEVIRVQDRDPDLLTGVNASVVGLAGFGSGGNADDANTNYARWDAASHAVKGLFELSASEGPWSAALRVKAWRDLGLLHDERPWGNVVNGYAADAPLSDAGAARRTRFDGVALAEAWVHLAPQ